MGGIGKKKAASSFFDNMSIFEHTNNAQNWMTDNFTGYIMDFFFFFWINTLFYICGGECDG